MDTPSPQFVVWVVAATPVVLYYLSMGPIGWLMLTMLGGIGTFVWSLLQERKPYPPRHRLRVHESRRPR